MEFWAGLIVVGFAVALLAYVVALRLQLMAVVDLLWSMGLGVGALAFVLHLEESSARSWLVVSAILLWSLRLSIYLFRDRVLVGHEDPRYTNLANYWGKHAKRNFLGLFLTQIPLVALFLLPVAIALQNVEAFLWLDLMALGVALFALIGEAVADRQLACFRAKPENRGRVCQDGLWRYSRHPNYFFEWLHWWAYVVFAWGSPHWWVSLIGPTAMYVFLRYLTGIPHAERSSLQRRGDAYRTYQQTTSAFFPWIPRQVQS